MQNKKYTIYEYTEALFRLCKKSDEYIKDDFKS